MRVRLLGLLPLLAALALVAPGCGAGSAGGTGSGSAAEPPGGKPAYSGVVIETDDRGVLVRADGDACGIWLRAGDETRVLRVRSDDYDEIAWEEIRPGEAADVWISGPIAESCPMQAEADAIVVSAGASGR
jgi:hypothetical protein